MTSVWQVIIGIPVLGVKLAIRSVKVIPVSINHLSVSEAQPEELVSALKTTHVLTAVVSFFNGNSAARATFETVGC